VTPGDFLIAGWCPPAYTFSTGPRGCVQRMCKGVSFSLPIWGPAGMRGGSAGVIGESAIRELEIGLVGSVIGPGDPNYETARRVWNHAIDKYPALVIRAASTEDVARTVGFARREGMPIAIRGGSHSIAGFSTCDDGIVIDLAHLNGVQVDVGSRRAVAGGGTRWRDFDTATQQHGLATTGGLVSSTGIGGFTLGGGIGHLVRKCGLACDNLLSAELVTGDGSVVHASESQESELLWALRGGGGNFGVVTKFELALHEVGPTMLGGVIFYPGQQAAQVMHCWRDLLDGMPEELSTFLAASLASVLHMILRLILRGLEYFALDELLLVALLIALYLFAPLIEAVIREVVGDHR
jgi:FAD/FMN-containing dehydrogenase